MVRKTIKIRRSISNFPFIAASHCPLNISQLKSAFLQDIWRYANFKSQFNNNNDDDDNSSSNNSDQF